MFLFIAGAMTSGHVMLRTTVLRMSSAMPWAIFPMTFAVQGAMSITLALSDERDVPRACLFRPQRVIDDHRPSGKVLKVSGPTNSWAQAVITTVTP